MGTVSLRRTGKDLASRAVENLYWLGRYAERSEAMMRVLRSVLTCLAEDSRTASDLGAVNRLLRLLLERGRVPSASRADQQASPDAASERQLSTLMFDPDCAYGSCESMKHLYRTATLARRPTALGRVANPAAVAQRTRLAPATGGIDTSRLAQGFDGRQLVQRRRLEGYLGP